MENIAKIAYINLDHRTDKKEWIEQELQDQNLLAISERFPGFYHDNTAYGCSMAHLNCIKHAKESNLKNILILEDDFTFLVSREILNEQLEMFFREKSAADYDVLFLSYHLREEKETSVEFLGQALASSTASGYLINGAYFDTLIELYETAFPLLLKTGEHWKYMNDVVWCDLQRRDRWFFLKQRIGKQRACVTDNGNVFKDYGF